MKPEISVIVPYHNENVLFFIDTINSIRDTIDVSYEIIVVDDHSTPRLAPIEGVTVLRHEYHKGVGEAFDTGVAVANSDNLFLMGSDIRFIPNNWASKMIAEIDENPKSFICTKCVGLNKDKPPDSMDVALREAQRGGRTGSTILIFHDHQSHPKMKPGFRSILECQWLPINKSASEPYEIPAILGAAYGVKKEWYNYVDGWVLHKSWGTLEPMISLKSWLMGGSCRILPSVSTGHVFKRDGSHHTDLSHLSYNKLLTATLLFPEEDAERLRNFLPKSEPQVRGGWNLFEANKEEIYKKRDEYKEKIVYDINDYVKRWEIDFRK